MVNVIRMQMHVMFSRKSTICMYFVMYILMLINFFGNVIQYYEYDIWNMYHPMKLVFLGENSSLGFYFMQYYPFLVVMPAGFSYFTDKNSGELIFIETRTSKKNYYLGTMIATFATTFMIFTFPLFIEMILNCIAFPMEALGDQSNVQMFEPIYTEMIQGYLFSELWLFNPYIYTFAMIALFGVVSGILACFAAVVSMFGISKFKILLFVPVYALLYLLRIFKKSLNLEFTTNYFFYLRIFCVEHLNETVYVLLLAILVAVIGMMLFIKMRKDELS